jgi:hypothetical protein
MELHLKIIASILIALSLVHIGFPKYFNWKYELRELSTINRQMMYVHSFFIAFVVFLIGLLCLTSSKGLIETELGSQVALGLSIFWGLRLIIQFFGYSSKLWWGKGFETIVHILFSFLWAYLSVIFFVLFWVSNYK